MAEFGGFGGLMEHRGTNTEDAFEMAVERCLGDKIKANEETAKSMWRALANVNWTHENGDIAAYSWRAAGDLIAAIRASGNYLDWYWSGDDCTVTDEIAAALRTEGWAHSVME